MRLPLLLIPLIALAGCTSDTSRAAAPATPSTPAAAAASAPSTPAVSAPGTPSTPAAPSATTVAAAAAAKPAPAPVTVNLQGFSGPTDNADLFGYDDSNGRLFFYSGGTITLPVKVTGAGDYEIVVSGACDEANGEKAKFSLALDGQVIAAEVVTTTTDAKDYVIKATGVTAGEHKIAIEFLNDVYKENEYDLNFYVHGVTLRPAK